MYACRAAGMAEALQRCNWSIKDALSEVLYSVHMFSDQPKAQSIVRYK